MNSTKQCLRCENLCVEPAIFCQHCQLSLLNRSLQKSSQIIPESFQTLPTPTLERSREVCAEIEVKRLEVAQLDDQEEVILPAIARRRRISPRKMRKIFIVLAILASVAFVVDSIIVSVGFTRVSHIDRNTENFPMLTVSPGIIHLGQVVQLHLSHFTPSSRVFLTHDIQEVLRLDRPSALVQVGKMGDADLHFLVEGSWGRGSHIIEAEDINTRYTASSELQVIGSGPVLPPQLQVSQSSQDMGIDWQGADTLHPLELHNNGGGIITWATSSDQPWLQLSPSHGVFSDSQKVTIAVTRSGLQAGSYQGTVKISSNTGVPEFIQIKMSVRALPVHPGPMLVVTPPILSLSSIDGVRNTTDLLITISNPGSSPLPWSIAAGLPITSIDQSILLQEDWLAASPSSGTLLPATSTTIHVLVHTHQLFPGVYSGLLTLTSRLKMLDAPQAVAVSVDVQQRCGVVADMGSMAFIVRPGQHTIANQYINVGATADCAGSVAWSVFSLADWLSVTPANGQVGTHFPMVATVGIGAADLLQSGTFRSFVVILTEHRTQTIAVQLIVLSISEANNYPGQSSLTATSTASTLSIHNAVGGVQGNISSGGVSDSALLNISPAELSFNISQGQTTRVVQSMTIANTGGRILNWQISTNALPSWLIISSTQGSLRAGQTATPALYVNVNGLSPGIYNTQITVNALDDSRVPLLGDSQVLPVILHVLQPCILQVTPGSLSFSASLLQAQPADQSVSLKANGNCSQPVSWQASVDSNNPWLQLSANSGSENGAGTVINIHVDTTGMLLGSYDGHITFTAHDSTSASVSISQSTVSVTLSVLG